MAMNDGGSVKGTGGGKFGAPNRWQRPRNAKVGTTVWTTTIMVDKIGDAVRGVRKAAPIDLVVGESLEGWVWMVRGQGRQADGKANDELAAKDAAVAAARSMVAELAARPRESESHPPIGPAVWPGV